MDKDNVASLTSTLDEAKSSSSSEAFPLSKGFIREYFRELVAILAIVVVAGVTVFVFGVLSAKRSQEDDLISAYKACYETNEKLNIDFSHDKSRDQWIGILGAKQAVESTTSSDYLFLTSAANETLDFAIISIGSYKAVLLECRSDRCISIGTSKIFTVQTVCNEANSVESSTQTVITTTQPIYEYGEDILVSFTFGTGANPRPDDWIGLFPALSTAGNLLEPIAFLYVCNQHFVCDTLVRETYVSFNFPTHF